MTSLQIAEITGKTHSNVMRDIRNILEQLEDRRQFSFELSSRPQPMPNGGSKEVSCYILTKKDCLLLASGYDANLRAKIINRWEELEENKRELEARIAEEKLAKPKVTEEFIRFWLLRFRKLDMSLKDQQQALVDTFINAIYLYDDKVLITFNYKEGTQTVTFGEATEVASEGNGSDLDCFTAPENLIAMCFLQ